MECGCVRRRRRRRASPERGSPRGTRRWPRSARSSGWSCLGRRTAATAVWGSQRGARHDGRQCHKQVNGSERKAKARAQCSCGGRSTDRKNTRSRCSLTRYECAFLRKGPAFFFKKLKSLKAKDGEIVILVSGCAGRSHGSPRAVMASRSWSEWSGTWHSTATGPGAVASRDWKAVSSELEIWYVELSIPMNLVTPPMSCPHGCRMLNLCWSGEGMHPAPAVPRAMTAAFYW